MAKNINNLDKTLKQNITPADIGAAAASHGTHLTIGTGASNAAAGNHTHSYLPLAGGTTTGGIKRSSFPDIWVAAAKDSNSIINSTASAGVFAPFFSGKTTNGSIVLACYQTGIQGAYLTSANVSAGTNTVTKNVTLMNESGGASWPGTVSANSFTENGTALSSKYATTATTGSLSSLQTSAKGSLVAAINEVFQSGANVKQQLVDVLVANGASVSTSDSWDTLINHINENSSNGGLDIISATSLPATGKENQLCAITNNPTDSFILSNDEADVMISGNNTIGLLLSDSTIYEKYSYSMGGLTINLRIAVTYQNAIAIPLWLYYNNAWKQICSTTLFILRNKVIQDGFTIASTNSYGTYGSKGISLLPGSNANLFGFTPFKESIDFSKYKAVHIKGTYQNTSSSTGKYGPAIGIFGVTSNLSNGTMSGSGYGMSDTQSVLGAKFYRSEVLGSNIKTATSFDITFDVSSITTRYYLGIVTAMTQYTYVTDIELIMN
jgi:hypothetical protein